MMTPRAFDSTCVCRLRALQVMPLRYKLAAMSSVLAPLLITYAATLSREGPISDAMYWCVVGVLWLNWALQIAQYVRGYFLGQKDMHPAKLDKRIELGKERERLVIFMFLFCLAGLVVIVNRGSDARVVLVLSAVFIVQLSNYAHHLFWNSGLESSRG
jgi:hypothetical protein